MKILDWLDIGIMWSSALLVFLCKYKKRRDATVGAALFVCWIYQIYETAAGLRISALSDVLFDLILFLIVLSAGGNIMSVVVFDGLRKRWLWIKSLFRWKHDKRPDI